MTEYNLITYTGQNPSFERFTMKLGQLNDVRFHAALSKLIEQPLPLRAAFKLKGISAKVQDELRKFDEVRQAALKQYGNKDENGELLTNEDNTVKFEKENLELFAKELNELSLTEVDVGTISVSELGDKLTVTADDLMALDGVVIE